MRAQEVHPKLAISNMIYDHEHESNELRLALLHIWDLCGGGGASGTAVTAAAAGSVAAERLALLCVVSSMGAAGAKC